MNALIRSAFDDFDNMFANIDALFNYNKNQLSGSICNRGLKHIRRPHNLITHKDDDGAITGYSLETVYTPFAKSDVSVEVLNNQLTVKCGSENKIHDEEMDYCGVSYQTYQFTLPLADNIDTAAIVAKAEDGMLRIDLPVKKEIEDKDVPLKIAIQ